MLKLYTMFVGVLKETYPNEKRVSLTPSEVQKLKKKGVEVLVEEGAGERAGFPDEEYSQAGAKLTSREEVLRNSQIVLKVRGLMADKENFLEEAEKYTGKVLIGFLEPFGVGELLDRVKSINLTAFAMELIPRTTRAQSMDVLSSMATVAGYKAALIGANLLPKMFPMLMTAAGTVLPAKVFVVGAGVAGLQAIATAKRLGAVVQAYDIRPAAKEQVLSLGAKFVELGLESEQAEDRGGYAKAMDEEFYRRQREMMKEVVGESDVVITTAMVPGKRAPVLVTEDMVRGMKPGSVIVDLAAERGGNCELTVPGETVEKYGVRIVGAVNLPAEVPHDASQMYSRNLVNFLNLLIKDGEFHIDLEDDIVRDTLLLREGELVNERIKELVGGGAS
ncbi:Re/Si-specific NAD(P)(+) transhydrogenase subunit alpha [Hydrogenivirga sp. 128-5-R1-1]|uniref:Re/Si-specific NAD(P)(+) transhydrogenase subunit alpha n=1 Tax=Hydrogenivirga sp. 128-5-R1-1 TaxID=392423 RepID=UPI00015F0A1B|nr:Re/Si-specific NAD(P)(+) transhydrogenase subunit alpha [Hydrogenivirga sp. 128-5-R1-1]EDP74446.1 NAD(P)(+) transhydrogenase (AB-specific) [Hydrogenivirga sp. 128-5-R1-1]